MLTKEYKTSSLLEKNSNMVTEFEPITAPCLSFEWTFSGFNEI